MYKGILALWSLNGLNKPLFRWTVLWYEICNELKNVPKHPQQVNKYIESWNEHVAVKMDSFISGISDKLILVPSIKDVKDTRSKLKKAKWAKCNYPLRSCSTTEGGRQPSENHIEDWMDIGEIESAVIILQLLCSLWRLKRLISVPCRSYWYHSIISLFNSISGGFIHKSTCNHMLLCLNAFYEWGQYFLS
jgi:hypothetical protein